MAKRPAIFRPAGQATKQQRDRVEDQRRGTAASRGYGGDWRKASRLHRQGSPLCRYCEAEGRIEPATLVDHFYPPRLFGAWLFWIPALWVSSCKPCHDGPKQAAERAGRSALDPLARRLGLPTLDEVEGEGG